MGILLLTLVSLGVVWPQNPQNYLPGPWPGSKGIHLSLGDWKFDRQGMTLGLDLQGGTHIVLEADVSGRPANEQDNAIEGAKRIIERRINAFGVAEPIIQRQGTNRISVQLPGVKDVNEAIRLIGQTAQLDFRELVTKEDGSSEWVKAGAKGDNNEEKELTGAFFRPNAAVVLNPTTSKPEVAFEFNDEGGRMFEQITGRNIQKPLGIFLDNELISAPTVQAVIRDRGVITGISLEEGRRLAIQLNAGALPVPVKIVQQQDVDATLGADSIKKSILAGEIGLGIVILFMVLYYRLPGVLAAGALLIYAVLMLAIFKLIPVTLTLAGIAAFILSIGMAVDANILIFERMREEIRAGFSRAWTSIRDSNISTLITCVILYLFGSNFGASLVMGFALTLGIGVVISMFTAITITRTFLRAISGIGLARNLGLFGVS